MEVDSQRDDFIETGEIHYTGDKIDYENLQEVYEFSLIQADSDLPNNLPDQDEVNDEERILLFRHIVDALVRMAYLKQGCTTNDLHKTLEYIITEKLNPLFDITKKKSKSTISADEEVNLFIIIPNHILQMVLSKYRGTYEPYFADLKAIFNHNLSKKQSKYHDQIDSSIMCSSFIKILSVIVLILDYLI